MRIQHSSTKYRLIYNLVVYVYLWLSKGEWLVVVIHLQLDFLCNAEDVSQLIQAISSVLMSVKDVPQYLHPHTSRSRPTSIAV